MVTVLKSVVKFERLRQEVSCPWITANVLVPDEEEIDSLTKLSLVMSLNTLSDTTPQVSTIVHESVPTLVKV